MSEIYQARTFNKHRIEEKTPPRYVFLMTSLAGSRRRCMDPVDYVYGVLGMFQFKIPRMSDPNAVWQRFLSELEKYTEPMMNDKFELEGHKYKLTAFDDRAYLKDLREAKDMSDVYTYVCTMKADYSDSE